MSLPRLVRRSIPLLLKAALGPGERWITIHPPGHEVGQPLLIQEHPDGTARVIGGAGGKLNYLKLRPKAAGSDYRQAAEQRAAERRQARKEQIAADKVAGTHEAKQVARADVAAQRQQHEAAFIDTVAEAMGWDKAEIAFPEKQYPNVSPAALAKLRQHHHNALLSRANQAVELQRQRLLADAEARTAAGVGEVPLTTAAPETLSVEDLDPQRRQDAGLGFSPEYVQRAAAAGLTETDLKQEVAEVRAEKLAAMTDSQRQAALKRGELSAQLKAEMDGLAEPPVPAPGTKLTEAKQAVALLKAQKQLKAIQRQAREANQAIDVGEAKAFVLDAEASEAGVQADLENDLRTIQTRQFLSAAAKLGDESLGRHVGIGAYNAINSLALAVGGDALVDRSVVDVLGVAGAAQVLARRFHHDLFPDDLERISQGVADYHRHHQLAAAEEALSRAGEWQQVAKTIRLESGEDAMDLQQAQELNARRREAVSKAAQILGTALGELEANAALTAALEAAPRQTLEVPMAGLDPAAVIRQARALGLQRGDYQVAPMPGGQLLTIRPDGLDRLSKPVSRADLRQVRRNLDIMEGAQDEADWLPLGVARRPDLVGHVPPGVVMGPAPEGGQDFEINAAAADALHRSFAALPAGPAAFKPIGDLSAAERRTLRASVPNWKAAVTAAGDPVKAYENARDGLQDQVAAAFREHYNAQHPSSPIESLNESGRQRLAQMATVVGQNFKPGQPVKLWAPTMSGGKNWPRQRLIKLLSANKRVMAAFGTGSGKSLLQLAGFSHLHGLGKVKRGLFLVPSVVQGQFSGEALRYLEPGQFKWHIEPGASREERIAAYKDPATHFAVMTHAAFRDDMLHLGAQREGVSPEALADRLDTLTPAARSVWMKQLLAAEGIDFDYLTVDESQDTLNRAGKENSRLANVVDAIGDITPYYMAASGDPVKNDASEIFDVLAKMDRGRYQDRAAFLRRYGADTQASRDALRRELARYVYPSRIDPDVTADRQEHHTPLSPAQRADLATIDKAAATARLARLRGETDMASIKALAPGSFAQVPEAQHAALAEKLQKSLGMLKDAAIQRTLYEHADNPLVDDIAAAAKARSGKPGVVFAHSRAAVAAIAQRLEADGHRVIVITGSDSATAKEAKRLAFNPEQGEAKADILVASDAAAVGLNIQRGQWLYQADTPDTAKTHAQRNGRIFRTGQKNNVELIDGIPDHPSARRARERLATKYGLRELMTTPLEGLDDTGVAYWLKKRNALAAEEQLAA